MNLPRIITLRSSVKRCTAFLALMVVLSIQQAGAQPPTKNTQPVPDESGTLYEQIKVAFVEILVDGHMAGSGALVDSKGYVITAAHVLARRGRRIEVLSPVAGRIKAKLVAVDIGHDLALLKLAHRDKLYPALTIAKATPAVGETCHLLGTPLYRHALLLSGKVARRQTGFEFMPQSKSYAEVYYIAGPSPPGTSGGVWVNDRGEVVGVQSMLMSVSNAVHGISFVVPPMAVAKLLATKRSASTCSLGAAVEEIWQHAGDIRKKFPQDARGLFVRSLRKDGPAETAGLKEWDLIQSVDEKPVERMEQLARYIRAKKVGESVKLVVLSPGKDKPRTVTIPLAELEAKWKAKSPPAKTDEKPPAKTPATQTRV